MAQITFIALQVCFYWSTRPAFAEATLSRRAIRRIAAIDVMDRAGGVV